MIVSLLFHGTPLTRWSPLQWCRLSVVMMLALLLLSGSSTSQAFHPPLVVSSDRPIRNHSHRRGMAVVVPFVSQRGSVPFGLDPLFSSSSSSSDVVAETNGGLTDETLQALFQQLANPSTGLMVQSDLMRITEIKEWMQEGELLQQDVDDIWQQFTSSKQQEADVAAFAQIYRAIDDLFEDDDDDDDDDDDNNDNTTVEVSSASEVAPLVDDETRQELEEIFQIIATPNDDDRLVLSQQALRAWDEVDTLIVDGMLSEDEFLDLWNKTPKQSSSSVNDQTYIELQGFIQFNAMVDELFDFDDLEEETTTEPNETDSNEPDASVEPAAVEKQPDLPTEDALFRELAGSENLVNKEQLLTKWPDLMEMIQDGDLAREELDQLYTVALKQSTDAVALDPTAFDVLRTAINDLFEEEDDEADSSPAPGKASLFQTLAGSTNLLVNKETLLSQWDELQEMIQDGDLLSSELDQMYATALKTSKDDAGLDEAAFAVLKALIDDLFEEEDDEDNEPAAPAGADQSQQTNMGSSKGDLLRALAVVNDVTIGASEEEETRLPCGLETTEKEETLVLALANQLIQEDSNLLLQTRGNIATADVAGTWKLLYTSSSAMKFNKGLSGLGGSFPNGKFGGLTQTLSASALLPDVEYKEHIEVPSPGVSFDVTVNGNWELRPSMSLFTGETSVVLAVEPDRVMYGPTSTKADHWKSLGPTNMLDVVYLDDDLRIMRGSTSMDTILIFQRV